MVEHKKAMLEPGRRIRNFVLEHKLGEGGMGEVWRARMEMVDRPVALKVMRPELQTQSQFEQRFIQEAKAMAQLSHHRIVPLYDCFSEQGTVVLVMPLISGEPLSDRIDRLHRPIALGDALSYSADILSALNYAHQKGIIHRDVKPSNILLNDEGHAYLTDFGISLVIGEGRLTRTGGAIGTAYYMSPEQIQTPLAIDHRADVYSYGCVLYEMLTGRPPFNPDPGQGDTDFLVRKAHCSDAPPPLSRFAPSVPAGLESIVMKALAKSPADRYKGCGEFARALEEFAIKPEPPKKPTKIWIGVSAGIAALMLAALAIDFPKSKPDPPAAEPAVIEKPSEPVPAKPKPERRATPKPSVRQESWPSNQIHPSQFAGVWESRVSDGFRQYICRNENFPDGRYKFSSSCPALVANETGSVAVYTNGTWSLRADSGRVDGGTFQSLGPNESIMTGILGSAKWTRVK